MGDIANILKRAISDVVERMCFLLPDPEDEASSVDCGDCVQAAIGITGKPRLRITIKVDGDLARLMASNALGAEEIEIDERKIEHFLLETANVIGGKFLLVWDGAAGRDLTIPSPEADRVFGPIEACATTSIVLHYERKRFSGIIEEVQ
ncbi:MAG: hypothetical protein BWY50_02144 [Spirochaetes bacterium ADurb.Bin315]|nr:MAG: hypothetical protein BWY50_02144 [Spirochaetes bacterium ADurb.Bin315]